MSASDIGDQAFAQFLEGVSPWWAAGEHSAMDIAETKLSSPSQLDPAVHLVPLDHRSGANSQFVANWSRNRDLALSCDSGSGNRHTNTYYRGNAQKRVGVTKSLG
jgi:hypothetical protein